MNEKAISELIKEAKEGISFALNESRYERSTGREVLPEILKGLESYEKEPDPHKLREVLDKYKKSNMLTSGVTDFNSIWLQDVRVKGKAIILSSILDELEDGLWQLVKGND